MTKPRPTIPARLAAEGFSLVPGDLDKRPKVQWGQWRDRRQTPEEFADLGHGSVWGIVTGQVHGLVVLDFDGDEGVALAKSLGLEPNVITGSGGWHVWVDAATIPYPVKTCAAHLPGMDVRGEGGLVWVTGRSRKGEYEIVSTVRHTWDLFEQLPHLFPERTAPTGGADFGDWDGDGPGTPSALRILRVQADKVRNAEQGTSNQALNKAGHTVGGLVAAGELEGEHAYRVLLDAAIERDAGSPESVLTAAMSSGRLQPWSAEPQVDEDGEIWLSTSDLPKAGEPVKPTPEFPLDVYPKQLADFVQQVATASGAPVSYVAASLLPTFGAAAGAHAALDVNRDGWVERPALWVALVGDPSANKSPALRRSLAPIKEAHKRIIESQDGDWKDTNPHQLIVSETTIEGLFLVLQANQRGVLLHVDELAGWVKSMNQYKGGVGNDRQHWLQMWSGEDININRVKGGRFRFVSDPFLCVAGGVQPDVLDLLMRDVEDGLAARLLLVPEGTRPPRTLRAPKVDPVLTDAFAERWNSVRDAWSEPGQVDFADDAFDVFADWYEGEWNKGVGTVKHPGPWGKLPAHVARFALVLSQMREPGTKAVTVADVEGALQLGRYFYDAAEHLYSTVDALTMDEKKLTARAEKVGTFLASNPEADRRSIQQRFKYDPRELDRIMDMVGRPDLRSSR